MAGVDKATADERELAKRALGDLTTKERTGWVLRLRNQARMCAELGAPELAAKIAARTERLKEGGDDE